MKEIYEIGWEWWDYIIIALSVLLFPPFTVIYAIIRMEIKRR